MENLQSSSSWQGTSYIDGHISGVKGVEFHPDFLKECSDSFKRGYEDGKNDRRRSESQRKRI